MHQVPFAKCKPVVQITGSLRQYSLSALQGVKSTPSYGLTLLYRVLSAGISRLVTWPAASRRKMN